MAYLEKGKDASGFSSPEVIAAFKNMYHLSAEGGIDGALDAGNADALFPPSVICSDAPGLVGYPIICPNGISAPRHNCHYKRNGRSNLRGS